jgi:hypothetical protein
MLMTQSSTSTPTSKSTPTLALILVLAGLFTGATGALAWPPDVTVPATGQQSPQRPQPSSMVDWKTGVMSDAWRRVRKPASSSWTLRVTPPLPVGWDGRAPLAWVIYGYGAGFSPQLADAERVAGPFAIGRIGHPPAPGVQPDTRVELLRDALDAGEPQGVYPVRHTGPPVDWGAVEQLCFSMTAPPARGSRDAARLREAYRPWLDGNGVIAGRLARDHRAFFDWLRLPD